MKTASLLSLGCFLSLSLGYTAERDSVLEQFHSYPKNLARQHLGSNLFTFNPSSQTYVPTEAAAAWLDEDITTGWPAMAGKQHYLLVFTEPQFITHFEISARPVEGTVSLYAADEPAAPSSKSWVSLSRGMSVAAINEHRSAKPFNRLTKYLLIETDIADSGPIYSLHVYGDTPAVKYSLEKRDESIDVRSIFGPYVNDQTSINTAGLHSQSHLSFAASSEGAVGWQKAVDDNPETAVAIAPSTGEASAVVQFSEARRLSRIALLTNAGTKGQLDFYAIEPGAVAEPAAAAGASLQGLKPTVSILLDGSNPRTSVDFAPLQASELRVRWTPANANETLALRELNTFDGMSLADYETALKPEAVVAFSGRQDGSKDGKEFLDPKDPKAIAAGPDERGPYLPGALGFPPNLTSRRTPPPLPPDDLSN